MLAEFGGKVNAENTLALKRGGRNVDMNRMESRHVPHGCTLCFVWALDIYI
jgi:hypothetical protein